MDKDLFNDDFTSVKSPSTKIDDFARNLKANTMDFLSHERSDEKIDAEKPKPDVDDFLNFHDDVGESKPRQANPSSVVPKFEKNDDLFEEPKKSAQPEPEIDFHALDDEYLNPYASSGLKGFTETQNEKFISSEDLLTDFKDPIHHEEPVKHEEPAKKEKPVKAPSPVPAPEPISEPAPAPVPKVELPKAVAPVEKPPVTEHVKPVEEPSKPKNAPPPAPAVRKSTSADTQIEAEKIFKDIGLG